MPPEPLPWDRKDFFKERKHHHERSSWRDSSSMAPYHHGGSSSRDFVRWGSADFRRPPGHGKQGGWHLFNEDSHGYAPLRSGDKILDEESFRSSILRGHGKYGRSSSRESRGSYRQRDWKGHSWEMSNASLNVPGRPHELNNEQRSVDDMHMLAYSSHAHSDFVNTWDQLQSKDQPDNKTSSVHGLGTGQRCEVENSGGSMDWKPLKWSRSGSLSSRGSGFSHSSSSKSLGGVDSNEGKVESHNKNVTPVQSPSGDAIACVTSAAMSDETTSRKKPRLGWGEGLAKYEKKKVEVPDATGNRAGAVMSVSIMELNNSLSSNFADKSPRVFGLSDCASPATPSSVACSSSPGVEEKSYGKANNIDSDVSNLCGSPSFGFQSHLEGCSFNLEKLDIDSIIALGSSINELLMTDDPGSVDSSFVRSTATSKLVVWKGNVLKALEVTESKIDSLENELKTYKYDNGGNSCLVVSSGEQVFVSDSVGQPHLQIDHFQEAIAEKMPVGNAILENVNVDDKDEDIDSAGTATSKVLESPLPLKAVTPSDTDKRGEFLRDADAAGSAIIQMSSVASGCNEDTATIYASGDVSMQGSIDNAVTHMEFVDDGAVGENTLYNIISATNREVAGSAYEVFNKLLPKDNCNMEFSAVSSVASRLSHSSIREKFVMQKRDLRFRERILTLKYKAFQHLWREDMRLLSIRKYRAKSQKKFESNLRMAHSGYQKHRSSIRSRFSSPAGSLSLVPTMEVTNYARKLLSDSHVNAYRNALKMPALILDEKEKLASRFVSSNGLVEDPCAVESERAMVNPWTLEEKEIFMDKWATFGKDFRKIASFLEHKTTADCIEFYYKNHKSDGFEKTKKKLDLSKQRKSSTNTYLVTSGKKWGREVNAASLDILGAASAMAANAESGIGRHVSSCRIFHSDSKTSRADDSITERSSSFDIIGDDKETVAADVLAGICGSLSSEAMSSCITSSIDPGESYREWKYQKVDSGVKRPSTPDVTQNVDDGTCSDESCGEMDPVDWTDEEKSVFIQAVSSYGKDFTMISRCVRTRSREQCKVFFSKARKCLGLDSIQPRPRNLGTSTSDDANGGGSDMEDACFLESSVVCGDKLGSKVDDNLPSTIMSVNEDHFNSAGTDNLNGSLKVSEEIKETGMLNPVDSNDAKSIAHDVGLLESKQGPSSEGDENVVMTPDVNLSELGLAQKSAAFSLTETGKDEVIEEGICIAESASVEKAGNCGSYNAQAMVDLKSASDCLEGFQNFEVQGPVLAKESLGEREKKCATNSRSDGLAAWEPLLAKKGLEEQDKCDADNASQKNFVSDSNSGGNESCAVDMNSIFSFNPQSPCQGSHNLDSAEIATAVSSCKENAFAPEKSSFQDSGSWKLGKVCHQDSLSSTLDFHESRNNKGQISARRDEQKHPSVNPVVNCDESAKVGSGGNGLQISTEEEMNGDSNCGQLSVGQRIPKPERKSERGLPGTYSQNCYLQKCNGTKSRSIGELPLLSQNLEQNSGHRRAHSRSLSDTEKPCRNGNVKLFGKILNSNSEDIDDKGSHIQKQSPKSSASKQSDGGSTLLKFDQNNYLGLENVPTRSLWDGRIQPGYQSLPDSAILLAKYPAAFGNYALSSSKMEHQAVPTVVKSNECNLSGVSVFPPREIASSNGMVDYPVYRSRGSDVSVVQPFTVDIKQRQDVFSEVHRLSGFESMPGLQQQGRGVVGVNVVGRAGILVGGPCTGVSDPVAALKMHYAKAEQQYGGQSGSKFREEESWRGKGDIGR